jgi:hypothetical protein
MARGAIELTALIAMPHDNLRLSEARNREPEGQTFWSLVSGFRLLAF